MRDNCGFATLARMRVIAAGLTSRIDPGAARAVLSGTYPRTYGVT